MDPELTAQRAPALRALEMAGDSLAALDRGSLDGAARRRAMLDAADAVESALRRWLRDSESIPIAVRLQAQSHEELREDSVLAELRQHNLLSVEAAASIHEMFELRRRLGAGSPPEPGDDRVVHRAVHRLQVELESATPPDRPRPHESARDEETLVHAVPAPEPPAWLARVIGAGGVALVLVLVAVAFWLGRRDDPGMAEGIALFRSGAYAEAASHFWRYAEANPDDATPHLYLARIHRRMRRPEMAGDEVRTALRLAPEDADAHAELGFLLLDTGRSDVAVERFRAALRLDPETASAWVGLVRALRADGRGDAAARVLARAPDSVREIFARRSGAAPGEYP